MNSINDEIRDQAVHFATEWGWPVLPLYGIGPDGKCACGKACSSPGKHPVTKNGLKDASTDPETIRAWFGDDRPLNVGIATGPASGIAVLDVDERSGGAESLRELLSRPGPNPLITVTARTGNGSHFYFRYPEGAALKNSAGKLGPGLDIRGEGGYVVAPPSVHANGKTYEFDLSFEELGEFPAPWLEALNGTAGSLNGNGKTAPGPPEARDGGIYIPPPDVNLNPEAVGEGGRNNTLASMAGKLRYYGFGQGAIEAALLAENERVCRPPLDRGEVLKIARSVTQNYEPQESLVTAAAGEDGAEDYENTLVPYTFGQLADATFEQKEILAFHLGKRDIAVMSASTNAGKTTILRNAALCMAAGRPFEPFYLGARPIKIAYFDFENDAPDAQRDLVTMFKIFTDAEKDLIRKNLIVIPKGLVQSELYQFNKHEKWTERLIRENAIEFAIVDNISAAYDLLDENSNSEVTRKVIKPLLSLSYRANAAFVFAHHTGKTPVGGVYSSRGASAIPSLSRTVFNLEGDVSEGELVTVECAKRKTDGGQNYREMFKLDRETRWFSRSAHVPPPKKEFAQIVREYIVTFPYNRPVTRAEIVKKFEGYSLGHIKRALNELVDFGLIEKIRHGVYCAPPDPENAP